MRDLLTEDDLRALAVSCYSDVTAMLQAAARLGAEREREQCAKVCEEHASILGVPPYCAAAIRRGEGE